MLEWHEYVDHLMRSESMFDGISLSFGEEQHDIGVPPIIKSSILMLDKMIQHQGQFNIMVFPERVQSIFIFTLIKLLHNVAQGKIERKYEPSDFRNGEKLKLGNAIVEFLGLEERKGEQCIKLRMADLDSYSAPIDFLPLFQRTDTQRGLSKCKQFALAKKKAENQLTGLSPDKQLLALLADYKTHMNSSIFNMASIIRSKEAIADCRLCGKRLCDILFIGQVDYRGAIKNVGAGQPAGIPSIVLAPDMYAILAATQNGHPVQSIIIDSSDSGRIGSQLDVLDDLMLLGVPITCVTDVVNSFDLQPFERRKFNIWRWDESSITKQLYDVGSLPLDRKIRNCATRRVEYLEIDGCEINGAIQRLFSHTGVLKESSIQMIQLFENLNSLAFNALRETIPPGSGEIERFNLLLDDAIETLASEKHFLSPVIYEDLKEIIRCLKVIYSFEHQLPKQKALSEYLQTKNFEDVCIVVPERSDKKFAENYWQTWCNMSGLLTTVHVLYPAEYYSASCKAFSATVIVGWLNHVKMRRILYSFNTQQYFVLLYDCENGWKDSSLNRWNAVLKSTGNKTIIDKSFCADHPISTSRFVEPPKPEHGGIDYVDELNEYELVLRENKFKQYVTHGGAKTVGATTEAVPVNYVGGFLAFYRAGHKVISVTKVITDDAEKIDTVLPGKLRAGDFVVVREADRDLIKEMADIMLSNSGKHGLREMATRWKKALEIVQEHSSHDEIYRKLLDAGCTKGYQAVRGWLADEDVIAPQQKQDLQHIAAITGSKVISDSLDQIYEAAREVRAAHVQAGRALSIQLRSKIVEALASHGDIDPSDILEPIEMTVEGIGPVKILKIKDVGSPIVVDTVNTNRLIEE